MSSKFCSQFPSRWYVAGYIPWNVAPTMYQHLRIVLTKYLPLQLVR